MVAPVRRHQDQRHKPCDKDGREAGPKQPAPFTRKRPGVVEDLRYLRAHDRKLARHAPALEDLRRSAQSFHLIPTICSTHFHRTANESVAYHHTSVCREEDLPGCQSVSRADKVMDDRAHIPAPSTPNGRLRGHPCRAAACGSSIEKPRTQGDQTTPSTMHPPRPSRARLSTAPCGLRRSSCRPVSCLRPPFSGQVPIGLLKQAVKDRMAKKATSSALVHVYQSCTMSVPQ